MPYSGIDDNALPDAVKKLPVDKGKRWVAVFNSVYSKAIEDGKTTDEAETSAFAQAWGVIGKKTIVALRYAWQEVMNLLHRVIEPDERQTCLIAERACSTTEMLNAVMKQAAGKDPLAWVTDIYHENGRLFTVIASGGKLYRADIMMAGDEPVLNYDWQEVKVVFEPKVEPEEETGSDSDYDDYGQISVEMSKARPRTILRMLPNGQVRWISVSCSATLDRVGEIDSRALFDSFSTHAEATGEYPIRMFYHAGEQFRTGQADFIGRDDHLLITSGVYDETEIAHREIDARMKEPGYWGESIGFLVTRVEQLPLSDGISIPVNVAGILREISTCPEQEAAAWFTATTIPNEKEERMLQGKQREAFVKLFANEADPEAAADAWLTEHADKRNRAIEETGMVTRAAGEAPVEAPAPAGEQPAEPATEDEKPEAEKVPAELVLDEDAVKAIATTLAEQMAPVIEGKFTEAINGLTVRLDQLEAVMKEYQGAETKSIGGIAERVALLEVEDEKRKAAWLADAPGKQLRATYRPRNNEGEGTQPQTFEDIAHETMSKFPVTY